MHILYWEKIAMTWQIYAGGLYGGMVKQAQ